MNLRVTLGVVAVAVVLGIAVFAMDRFNLGPSPQADATATSQAGQTQQIFQFDDARVTSVELRQGEKTVRATKSGDAWTLADTGEAANRSSFNSLVVRMSTLRATRRVDTPGELGQYGLEPFKNSFVAELDDGSRLELQTGSQTPVRTGTYAKRADQPEVYVIADQLATDIERLLNDPKEPPTPTPRPATPTPEVTPTVEATGTPTP
jgi:Domain of unknown function (DUF4340)